MLRGDLTDIKNCNNIIHITYYGTEDNKDKVSELVDEELSKNPHIDIDYVVKDDDGLNVEVAFDSSWVTPLQFLQHLCNKYDIDIIGVAYEFTDGYVEAFEFKNQLREEEEVISHEVLLTSTNLDLEEEVTELPLTQDEDILESEFPDPEKLDLSDDEILKSYQ